MTANTIDTPALQGGQALLPERLEQARTLLTILIIMAFLAGLSLLFARGAGRLSNIWEADLQNQATVQIISATSETREADLALAETTLRTALPQAALTLQSEADSRQLLTPWIGDAALPDSLPLPSILTLRSEQPLDQGRLSAALNAAGLNARVDTHQRFADRLRSTARRLVGLGTLLLLLLVGVGVLVNAYAARASLAAQREIVSVLVQVGAENQFISRLFIRQAARRGGIASLIGIGLAFIIWLGLNLFQSGFPLAWTAMGGALMDIIWLILLAVFMTAICAIAAGWSAARELSRQRRRA